MRLVVRKQEPNKQDPKTQKPVRQPELPNKNEPVQKQPANDRPVEGQGITKDEREQEQPADNKRALMVGLKGTKRQRPSIAKGPPRPAHRDCHPNATEARRSGADPNRDRLPIDVVSAVSNL